MDNDKDKYERRIKDSQLFQINRETEYSLYKRESYRMIENLYCYLMAMNEHEYEPYGCEITEVATRCIDNYECEKGDFLHYFNAAWRKEYRHIRGREAQDSKYRGVHVTETDCRDVRVYLRYLDRAGALADDMNVNKRIAELTGFSEERIRELAQIHDVHVVGDVIADNDGEEYSLWDTIQGGDNPVDTIESSQVAAELLELIEQTYCTLQQRQRPIVSDMITIRLCSYLLAVPAEQYSFISREIMDEYVRYGSVPTQRDIAAKYHRDETSISRTMNGFIKRLKQEG